MGDAEPTTNPRAQGRSSPWMARLRKRGQKLLHSKYVVTVVILLTITDCALVIAELILDLYSVKKTLSASEKQTYTFINTLRDRYPEEIHQAESISSIYDRLAHSTVLWNSSRDPGVIIEGQGRMGLTVDFFTSPIPVRTTSSDFQMEDNGAGDGSKHRRDSESVFDDSSHDSLSSRARRSSVRGSFNNDKSRILSGSSGDFKNLDYLLKNESFHELFREFIHVYRKSSFFVSSDNSTMAAKRRFENVLVNKYDNYNDDDDDINDDDDDDDEDGFRDPDAVSGDKASDTNDNSYLFALQQLSHYISMQIQSTVQDASYKSSNVVNTTPFSFDLSASSSQKHRSSSSASSLTPSSSSSSSSVKFSPSASLVSSLSPSSSVSSSSSSSSSSMFPRKSNVPELYESYIPSPTSSTITSSQWSKSTSSSLSSSPSASSTLKSTALPSPPSELDDSNSNAQFDDVINLRVVEPLVSRYTSQGKDGAAAHESILQPSSDDISDNDGVDNGNNHGNGNNYGHEDIRKELHHSYEMEIAHKLHFASLGVVSILMVEVMLKIICSGSHFLKRRIEVFDAIVIVTSVVVDLIFIKGLSEFAVDDSIFVLAFLLPWRVIRVVNSLVMAAIDHEHVKLRLLYSRKKKLDKTVETLRNDVDELKGLLQDIRQFCIKEGIEASTMDEMMGKFAPRRRKDSKFYTLVKLVMSTASINNDNVSISSSSMENELRDYAYRDSIINDTSNENTITSLKQYLSVPFRNSRMQQDSRSNSDLESNEGGPPMSPCIFVTSPNSDEEAFKDDAGMSSNDGHEADIEDESHVEESVFSFGVDEISQQQGERESLMKPTPSASAGSSNSKWRNLRSVFNFDNEDNKPATSLVKSSTPCKVHNHISDLARETSFIDMPESPDCDNSPTEKMLGAEGGVFVPLTGADSYCVGQTEKSIKPNQNDCSLYRGTRFLSVPPINIPQFHPMYNSSSDLSTVLSVDVDDDSRSAYTSNNNNNNNHNNNISINICNPRYTNHSLPSNSTCPIKRSTSELVHPSTTNFIPISNNNININNNNNSNSNNDNNNGNITVSSDNSDNVHLFRYDSPTPKRKSDPSPKRLSPSSAKVPHQRMSIRRNSATTERESKPPKGRSSSSRIRHNSSGDPTQYQSKSSHRRCQSERSRSNSPSRLDLLSVPGSNRSRQRRDDKSLPFESRSMQDVRNVGNTNANNLSADGKLLRSSCLSLNGERRKRGKSPHRVSFKVS